MESHSKPNDMTGHYITTWSGVLSLSQVQSLDARVSRGIELSSVIASGSFDFIPRTVYTVRFSSRSGVGSRLRGGGAKWMWPAPGRVPVGQWPFRKSMGIRRLWRQPVSPFMSRFYPSILRCCAEDMRTVIVRVIPPKVKCGRLTEGFHNSVRFEVVCARLLSMTIDVRLRARRLSLNCTGLGLGLLLILWFLIIIPHWVFPSGLN